MGNSDVKSGKLKQQKDFRNAVIGMKGFQEDRKTRPQDERISGHGSYEKGSRNLFRTRFVFPGKSIFTANQLK